MAQTPDILGIAGVVATVNDDRERYRCEMQSSCRSLVRNYVSCTFPFHNIDDSVTVRIKPVEPVWSS